MDWTPAVFNNRRCPVSILQRCPLLDKTWGLRWVALIALLAVFQLAVLAKPFGCNYNHKAAINSPFPVALRYVRIRYGFDWVWRTNQLLLVTTRDGSKSSFSERKMIYVTTASNSPKTYFQPMVCPNCWFCFSAEFIQEFVAIKLALSGALTYLRGWLQRDCWRRKKILPFSLRANRSPHCIRDRAEGGVGGGALAPSPPPPTFWG